MKNRFFIVLPVLIGIVFSILAISIYGFDKIEFGDTEDYINGANAFLNHTQYPLQSVFHPMVRRCFHIWSHVCGWFSRKA
jgi:hypothetical protein